MSAPAVKRTCYDDPVETELQRWPGVTWRREVRGKHYALVLTFGGVSRFVIYPTSPGDTVRGPLNHLSNVRQELRAMGATRVGETKAAQTERRRRTRPAVRPLNLSPTEPQAGASPNRDPWAALAEIKIAPPPAIPVPPASMWSRFVGFVRATIARFA